MTKRVVFADIETTGVQNLYSKAPREQFRLGQWAFGREGDIHLTEDYDEFISVMESADLIVGHNYIPYDLTSLYGKDSLFPLELALQRKVLDTMVWYPLRNRVPINYERRDGTKATTYQNGKQKPELVQRFLSLDNLTFQHDLPGKLGSLKGLAKKYDPEKTPDKELDFGLIPTDDPDYREYARQDIVAGRALACWLMDQGPITHYDWREMLVVSINTQISKNGFRVDTHKAQSRVDNLLSQREETMSWLVEKFDFPTEGKSPWASSKGKEVIVAAFAEFGVTPETRDWPRTPKGALKLGGDELIELAEGTEAEDFALALAGLKGARPLAQKALDSLWPDGKVHPEITALQRSGRFSMTEPSLPTWTAKCKTCGKAVCEHPENGAREKEYFVASPGCKLVEFDFSNADQRIVAALSGDQNYATRFEPGVDGHEVSGRLMFGNEVYESDPVKHRTIAKALSHAFAYNAGTKTLARTSKLPDSDDPEQTPLALAQKFVNAMNSAYPKNARWRKESYRAGESGWITNDWGRRMPVDIDRAYTQAPGLLGQSGTREILVQGLIAIAVDRIGVLRWLVATVHDALVWDIPEAEIGWAVPWIKSKMETTFFPKGLSGQAIEFPVSVGTPADSWYEAGH